MVPMTRRAHLDHVAGVVPLPFAGEPLQLLGRRDAASERGQAWSEDVRHEHELVIGTDRTRFGGDLTDLTSGTDQLGVGVAHLVTGQSTTTVLVDEVLARQSVVDLPR